MARVYDVAAYILHKQGGMTAMKLQKLCYYSHAWHLVWEERPLFDSEIEAWANGPVVRDLYRVHRREFRIERMPDTVNPNPGNLSEEERTTVDAVLEFYGPMSAHQLSELTHAEKPWQVARAGLAPGEWSNAVIRDDQMADYYDSLTESATQRT